jgi:hypothetical protein
LPKDHVLTAKFLFFWELWLSAIQLQQALSFEEASVLSISVELERTKQLTFKTISPNRELL